MATKVQDFLEFSVIQPQDATQVDDLLVSQFLRQGAKLKSNTEDEIRPWLCKLTKPMIAQGVSLKIYDLSDI